MEKEPAEARARRAEDVIADILAYFAAKKRYSYVDMLGNALDNIIALEALKDAIRDFKSSCIDHPGTDEEAICPHISAEDLERAAQILSSTLAKSDTKELILVTREIYVRALARAPRFSHKIQSGGEGY
ncbi:MAG: hypothetical protein F7C08_02985 [Desulfurococcales archaeon]|nr:hypothetical protein [Desulfurococcales archaeon]MCE4605478.1 hypothetical protein [Desulfurococcales archaeon]